MSVKGVYVNMCMVVGFKMLTSFTLTFSSAKIFPEHQATYQGTSLGK